VPSRRYAVCANLANSNSSFNWVGKNWAADATTGSLTTPSTVPAQTHIVSSFTIVAPSDQPFLRTGTTSYFLQGGANGITWSTISSGTTAGTAGESITINTTAQAPFQYHRVAVLGDGISQVGIARVSLNIADAGQNEI
jgi:hypothetical protein